MQIPHPTQILTELVYLSTTWKHKLEPQTWLDLSNTLYFKSIRKGKNTSLANYSYSSQSSLCRYLVVDWLLSTWQQVLGWDLFWSILSLFFFHLQYHSFSTVASSFAPSILQLPGVFTNNLSAFQISRTFTYNPKPRLIILFWIFQTDIYPNRMKYRKIKLNHCK